MHLRKPISDLKNPTGMAWDVLIAVRQLRQFCTCSIKLDTTSFPHYHHQSTYIGKNYHQLKYDIPAEFRRKKPFPLPVKHY